MSSSSSPPKPSPYLLLLLLFLLSPEPSAGAGGGRGRHVITFAIAGDVPSGLAWDPTAQHFLVGSLLRPSVSSVSDAGVVEELVSDPSVPPSSPALALAVDAPRRRLLVALARPAALASYDLRSPRPHRRIFAAPLPDPSAVPGAVDVDPATGDAFVTGGGVVWKVDARGIPSVLSQSPIYGSGALGGAAHVSRGFLLAAQGSTGRVFKVDAEDGAAREVLGGGGGGAKALAAEAIAVAVQSDGSAVVAGGGRVRWLKSGDGWGEAAVYDEAMVEGGVARGAAVREGNRAYVLVTPPPNAEENGNLGIGDDGGNNGGKRYRIEEVVWAKEEEGEMVWAFVLVGLGLAYFVYWRFQMGQLVNNMNKKRA
ncbi:uncharacterized protein LOC109722183 isoform X2 [Ananas comosus]|uniref:Uncharacterized protein LOC109722183 isoform X1 n=1 Tax=Ananas comosus TaxID=4615 RepID=A0A6P5GC47_ANACO|nr:uncharacterized protein LOC109722183 isoform X1 [Ananas comosus]XP_020105694.1 uncharacterized protein LOC109722183 isoform X2 [Ananas comosus]